MDKIGIIVSSHLEAKVFGVTMGNSPIREIDNFVIACCGPGQRGVEDAILHLTYHGVDRLISWGFAGGIVPFLRTGTILMPEQIIHPFGPTIDCDLSWHQKVKESIPADIPLNVGPIMHSDNILATKEEKQYGALRTFSVAVDQESFYIAQWGQKLKLPTIVIRVVLDDIFTELPMNIQAIQLVDGSIDYSSLFKFLFHPKDWGPLLKLKKQFTISQSHLRSVAEHSIKSMPFH